MTEPTPDDPVIDPRVTAVLDRFHDAVREATREALAAFEDLVAIDPTLRLPPLPHRHAEAEVSRS